MILQELLIFIIVNCKIKVYVAPINSLEGYVQKVFRNCGDLSRSIQLK